MLIQHSSIYVKYDLRKDVLEQKVKKALEEIGFSKKIIYKVGLICAEFQLIQDFKNLFRWSDGPPHAGVPPVVVIFKEKKDRVEVYNAAREGFKKNGWVVTEDSKYFWFYRERYLIVLYCLGHVLEARNLKRSPAN